MTVRYSSCIESDESLTNLPRRISVALMFPAASFDPRFTSPYSAGTSQPGCLRRVVCDRESPVLAGNHCQFVLAGNPGTKRRIGNQRKEGEQ